MPNAGPAAFDSDREWWYTEYTAPQGYAIEPPPGTPLTITVDLFELNAELAVRRPMFASAAGVASDVGTDASSSEALIGKVVQRFISVRVGDGGLPTLSAFEKQADCYRLDTSASAGVPHSHYICPLLLHSSPFRGAKSQIAVDFEFLVPPLIVLSCSGIVEPGHCH